MHSLSTSCKPGLSLLVNLLPTIIILCKTHNIILYIIFCTIHQLLRYTYFIKSSLVTIIFLLIDKNVLTNGENVECNNHKSDMIFTSTRRGEN